MNRQYGYWQTKLSSTDLDVVERFRDVVGAGRIYKQKRSNPEWKLAYQHCISRRAAKIDEALAEMRGRVYKPGRRPTPQAMLVSH